MRSAAIVLALLLSGCTKEPPPLHPFDDLLGRSDVVTLTNLHPDEAAAKLYATNYQQVGLIPVCSRVTLLERNTKRLLFRNEASGKTYHYVYHPSAVEPLPDHLMHYFGTEVPAQGARRAR